jgi:hypothetical protein
VLNGTDRAFTQENVGMDSTAECTLTATSLHLHAFKFEAQLKSRQQRCILPPELGLTMSYAGGARDHEIAAIPKAL